MKVKIGNKIYNSFDEPIMIILSDQDKENIKNMDKNCTKFCSYPEGLMSADAISEWMDEIPKPKLRDTTIYIPEE